MVDIPPRQIYGVVNDAWMQPIKEIGSGKQETLLLVGPGQDYRKDFKGEVIQSDTFLVLYFYRALGTGDEAKKLRTAVHAYKLSDAANPPKTKFINICSKVPPEVPKSRSLSSRRAASELAKPRKRRTQPSIASCAQGTIIRAGPAGLLHRRRTCWKQGSEIVG